MAPHPDTWLNRYLAVRRPAEVLAWVLLCSLQVLANAAVVWIDVRHHGLPFAAWEVITWEASSNLAWLVLVPALVWGLNRKPLHWAVLARNLPWHVAGSLLFCVLHVAGMVALRHIVYAARGRLYEFGPWLDGLFYESLKDIRSYALIVSAVLAYRLLLWRWQGEARWLDAPDVAPDAVPHAVFDAAPHGTPAAALPAAPPTPPAAPAPAPERILVKKLGKEFLLPMAEVEWVQACGNYVNLHRQQHDYPLRTTLAAIEQQLDASIFVRVHRSYLVNLALVQVIEPTEAGDARLRLRDGSTVPCSRTHLDPLRQRLGAVRANPSQPPSGKTPR